MSSLPAWLQNQQLAIPVCCCYYGFPWKNVHQCSRKEANWHSEFLCGGRHGDLFSTDSQLRCFIQWRFLNNAKQSSSSIYKVHKNYIAMTSRISLHTISANQHRINNNKAILVKSIQILQRFKYRCLSPPWDHLTPYLVCMCPLLGGSGGVVNSLVFCPASIKSLGCFYFLCVVSSQWTAVTVNLRILHCQL